MTGDDSQTAKISASFAADEKSVEDMEDWLRQNVVVQYWKGECDSRPNAACRFSNIAVDWFVFLTLDSTVYKVCL